MSKVRAVQQGYDNSTIRNVGDVFDWPDTIVVAGKTADNPIPEWCEAVEDEAPVKGKGGKGGQGGNLA